MNFNWIFATSFVLSTANAMNYWKFGMERPTMGECAYFNTRSSILQYPLSKRYQPQIEVSLANDIPYDYDLFVDAYFFSPEDLQTVEINRDSVFLQCLEDCRSHESCQFPNWKSGDNYPDIFAGLDKIIDQKTSRFPIAHASINASEDASKPLTYEISEPGVYCTALKFSGGSTSDSKVVTQEEMSKNMVAVTEQRVHGKLTTSSFATMLMYFYTWVAYTAIMIRFGYHVYCNANKDKHYSYVNTKRSTFSSSSIQFKILVYLFYCSVYYCFKVSYNQEFNTHGDYQHMGAFDSVYVQLKAIFLASIELSFITLVSYNFLLLSSGEFFGLFVAPKKILMIRTVTAFYVFHQVVSMVSIYVFWTYLLGRWSRLIFFIEELFIFGLGSFWAYETYQQLDNRVIKRKLAASYILICFVFLTYFACERTGMKRKVVFKLYQHSISAIQLRSKVSTLFSLCATALVVFIWRDVRLVSNKEVHNL